MKKEVVTITKSSAITKSKIPTEAAVDREIAKLESLRHSVPNTALGAGIHDQIKAQIQVLRELMDMDRLQDRFEDGDEDVFCAALNAREWMIGDGGQAESKGWAQIIHRAQAA